MLLDHSASANECLGAGGVVGDEKHEENGIEDLWGMPYKLDRGARCSSFSVRGCGFQVHFGVLLVVTRVRDVEFRRHGAV